MLFLKVYCRWLHEQWTELNGKANIRTKSTLLWWWHTLNEVFLFLVVFWILLWWPGSFFKVSDLERYTKEKLMIVIGCPLWRSEHWKSKFSCTLYKMIIITEALIWQKYMHGNLTKLVLKDFFFQFPSNGFGLKIWWFYFSLNHQWIIIIQVEFNPSFARTVFTVCSGERVTSDIFCVISFRMMK